MNAFYAQFGVSKEILIILKSIHFTVFVTAFLFTVMCAYLRMMTALLVEMIHPTPVNVFRMDTEIPRYKLHTVPSSD